MDDTGSGNLIGMIKLYTDLILVSCAESKLIVDVAKN